MSNIDYRPHWYPVTRPVFKVFELSFVAVKVPYYDSFAPFGSPLFRPIVPAISRAFAHVCKEWP